MSLLATTLRRAGLLAGLIAPESAEVRRGMIVAHTRDDPLLFVLWFLHHHITDPVTGKPSLSVVHEEWIAQAKEWAAGPATEPQEHRDAFVAPREMGKSTWWFLLLPLWAAAHGHVRFAAAFAHSGTQAEEHLATLKKELDTNAVLREVFPDLCKPALRPRGVTMADNRGMLQTKSGFVFAARGIDSGNLGMKVGSVRPDLLILDDVEPGESNYSNYQVEKRLSTITDVVLPLNVRARVAVVGTVTMPGSIIHQLVEHDTTPRQWITDEGFEVHHALPLVEDEAGNLASVWEEKWSLDYLLSIRHTRSFAKNFLNQPVATDGDYWQPDDFRYGDVEGITRTCLSVDPAVTTKTTSDFTGLAVVGWSPSAKACLVSDARAVKLTGAKLRLYLIRVLADHPEVTFIFVESNQGGDVWHDVFHDLPVPVKTGTSVAKKEVRAAETLNHYQRGRVLHVRPLPELEQQMCAFPKAPNDDMLDAVGAAVNRFLKAKAKRTPAGAVSVGYV